MPAIRLVRCFGIAYINGKFNRRKLCSYYYFPKKYVSLQCINCIFSFFKSLYILILVSMVSSKTEAGFHVKTV